jgi:S-adenosylmethionine:tRNA ribosyltransferase-isomerase
MRVDLFDFELPQDRIALRPARPRDSARLLVVGPGGSRDHAVLTDLPKLLRRGDVVVINDSKVIPARLRGRRDARAESVGGGAAIEVTLHKRIGPDRFVAFARPAKRLCAGDIIRFGPTLSATAEPRGAGEVEMVFDRSGTELDAAISVAGEMPLPPYIASKRATDEQDRTDYQTMFADREGSVAAPTAGLHFTPELVAALGQAGIGIERITLHVGAGTFLPVSADDTSAHRMHGEFAILSEETASRLNSARRSGGRIVAVGTTALRTLESAAESDGMLRPFSSDTDIFITPGYRFKAVDALLTNFHLPRSTLFMLVCAFSGIEPMKDAYREAIAKGYRFYSYGDACLLFRQP